MNDLRFFGSGRNVPRSVFGDFDTWSRDFDQLFNEMDRMLVPMNLSSG